MSNNDNIRFVPDDEQYPGEDIPYSVDELLGYLGGAPETDADGQAFKRSDECIDERTELESESPSAERAKSALNPEPTVRATELGAGDASDGVQTRRRLTLEERLKLIDDEQNDLTLLFGTCDQDMLKIASIMAPLLEMHGAASGFKYVNPARSLSRAIKRGDVEDISLDAMDNIIIATNWLSDAWERKPSAPAMEIMRNLVVREVLDDPELRFIALSRIERTLQTVRSLYEGNGLSLREKRKW